MLLPTQIVPRPGASEQSIRSAEDALGVTFPSEYTTFLKLTNGWEGSIGDAGYVAFYAVEDLYELNKGYRVEEVWPDSLLFGTDRGGIGYSFRKGDGSEWPVVAMEFCSSDAPCEVADSLEDFLEKLRTDRVL